MEKLVFIVSTYFIMLMQWAIEAVQCNYYVDSTFKKYFDKN